MALTDTTRTVATHRDRLLAMLETPAPAPVLNLTIDELEELLVAVGDRQDLEADPGRRARLQRARRALELELARHLARA